MGSYLEADPVDYFIEQLVDRNVVIVVGAGLTASCGLFERGSRGDKGKSERGAIPGWPQVLRRVGNQALTRINEPAVADKLRSAIDEIDDPQPDYPAVWEKMSRYVDSGEVAHMFTHFFPEGRADFSRAYDGLDKLDQRFIVSLNFDKFLETYFLRQRNDTIPAITRQHVNPFMAARRARNAIIRLHGEPESGTMVFGISDFARNESSPLMELFRQIVGSNIVLFVGCSIVHDPALKEFVSDGESRLEAFVYCNSGQAPSVADFATPLVYSDPADGGDPYAHFSDGLMELAELIEAERVKRA